MDIQIFGAVKELIAGLIVGIAFGFVLNKAAVTRFSTIVGQLMLKDFTVMKVIMTAIGMGSLGLYFLKANSIDIAPVISSTTLLAALIGGSVFGIGMAVLGFCPGTCVGALSSKAKDAWFGVIGMVLGAGLYAEVFPWVKTHIKPDSAITKATLAEQFQISPWLIIGGVVLFVLGFILFDLRKRQYASQAI